MGRLLAIADLHIGYGPNLEAWNKLRPHPEDGLIIAGDVGEKIEHLRQAFSLATAQFKQVFWVPGNHELYTMPPAGGAGASGASDFGTNPNANPDARDGEAKYMACVDVAREYGVLTPEDDYATWDCGDGNKALVCPVFTLYDYSFRPAHVTREQALDWAMEENVQATDELLLHPTPYPTRDAWCDALITKAENRLGQAAMESGLPLIIINHWPLREDLVFIPRVPRFSLWCGSKRTKDWHLWFNAKVVVTGHLHLRRTDWKDSTRFEEVSLGYPRQWEGARGLGKGINEMLREILPGPESPPEDKETRWRILG
ncbi:metallophosphoesterase-like protein [Thozetella sp. PMI_491]|nr:metallophosphoesterase-like protein [Thozetella sp. PMI_491]